MRMLASQSNWPPTHVDELAALLGRVPYPQVGPTRDSDTEYVLTTAIAELSEWFEVRPNEKQQPPGDRYSMLLDLEVVMLTRGPAVQSCTPSAGPLMELMRSLLSPPSQADATLAAERLASLRAELIEPTTLSAAFRDLLAALQDAETSPQTIAHRLSVFTGVLELADRGVAEVCHQAGAIIDDQALEINYVRHLLDGTAIEEYERPDDLAG